MDNPEAKTYKTAGDFYGARADAEKAAAAPLKFKIEPFEAIKFEAANEWLAKRIFPAQGVGALYGASQAFKSFIALHFAFHVALGWDWAGRRVKQRPSFYIAAEGSAGLRKRKIGLEQAHHEDLPEKVPFYLISTAPNLGTEKGDLAALIASIEAFGVKPGLIVIDTLAQSLGGADENNAGMVAFVANATALANHFHAFVLIVHHIGLADDKRLRGHTSLIGALDAQALCESQTGELSSIATMQKLKDEESAIKFTAHLARIVIGQDEDGDDISTLIVARIEDGPATQTRRPAARSIPKAQRLLMEVVLEAIDEAGEDFQLVNGPSVRAAPDDAVRSRYYARVAEQAKPDEDRDKLADRRLKSFNRAIKAAIDANLLSARERNCKRYVWLP